MRAPSAMPSMGAEVAWRCWMESSEGSVSVKGVVGAPAWEENSFAPVVKRKWTDWEVCCFTAARAEIQVGVSVSRGLCRW